ncbi:MAG: hypothetical protein O3A14_17940 [Cyanobacteria bacterium]|nr:hypothetical protein [Cyanobacteriota bacterium]
MPLLDTQPHRWVALVAKENRGAGWQLWADEVICSVLLAQPLGCCEQQKSN